MATSPLSDLAQQERTRREILHKGDLIRPLPDVVVRVLGMLNDGKTEPAELEKHLQVDQVLVAKLLGMVNSPFYGLARSIKSVREAITVLGFRGLRSLLLASNAAKYMNRDFKCYGHDSQGMLKHSFCVGSAARGLAMYCSFPADTREELFVAGLLHDIGKMLLVGYLEKHKVDPARFSADITEYERELIGIDHTECGALVAAKWNLSQNIQELLKSHHDLEVPEPLRSSLAVLRIANAYLHERRIGYVPEWPITPEYAPEDLARLQLSGGRLEEARSRMEEAVQGALDTMKTIVS